MAVWLTYSLTDFLLFSPQTYDRLFELYNRAIWPLQIVALGLGVAILALLRRPGVRQGRAIAAILAACWLWVGWAFHLERYATINPAATYFAAGFALQALLLAWVGIVRGRLTFQPGKDLARRAGLCLFVLGLAVQPLLGLVGARTWRGVELFGTAPDPTVVATLGLLTTADRVRWELLAVPILWCAIGGAALWAMEAPHTLVMPLVAAASLLLAVWETISGPGPSPPTRAGGDR